MPDRPPVWVTGQAVMAGGVADLAAFDALLRRSESRASAFLAAPPWDPWLSALPSAIAARARRAARTASPALRASVQVAVAAVLSAGDAALEGADIGLVVAGSNLLLGRAFQAFEKFQQEPAYLSPRHGYEFYDTHVMGVIAETLGLHGPGMTVGGASASGNVAVGVALDLIRAGRAQACLVVGPLPDLSPAEIHALRAMGALAPPDQPCRPFDRAASGFVPGQACAAVLLEAADRARARGAGSLAVLAGASWVQGANHLPAPDAEGELRAMAGALRDAGIGVGDLDLISAHATSTPAGDAAECEAIRHLLGGRRRDVAVNAPKSLFGHALHAAGVVELVALIRQIQGGFIHGTANLADPIADDLWLVGPETIARPIRYGLSNAFGFGSIAASIVVRSAEDRT
ncbi:MAG: beta-ketoacyl synthase N-terminal-like domain-containing protein [Acetobacteraceae bacterium]